MQEICAMLKIRKIQTTAYHPQTDGLVERMNRTLIEQLKRLAITEPTNWERYLPFVLFAYRATPQKSTRFTPYFLMYGREPNLAVDNLVMENCRQQSSYDSYAYFLTTALQSVHNKVLENISKAQERQKLDYDKHTKTKKFELGQLVMWRKPKTRKLDPEYQGPYEVRIVDGMPPNVIAIGRPEDPTKLYDVSVHRVKPFISSKLRI
jgi:hypothetical protein